MYWVMGSFPSLVMHNSLGQALNWTLPQATQTFNGSLCNRSRLDQQSVCYGYMSMLAKEGLWRNGGRPGTLYIWRLSLLALFTNSIIMHSCLHDEEMFGFIMVWYPVIWKAVNFRITSGTVNAWMYGITSLLLMKLYRYDTSIRLWRIHDYPYL